MSENRKNTIFPNTPWTLLVGDSKGSEEALRELMDLYLEPMYLVARGMNLKGGDWQDAVHSFVEKCLKEEKMFQDTRDLAGGKFRIYLRSSLRNFIKDGWRKGRAEKRGGGKIAETLEDGMAGMVVDDGTIPTDSAYDVAFALAWWEQVKKRFVTEESDIKFRERIFNHLVRGEGHREMTNAKLADELGLSTRHLERQIRLAKDRLKILAMEEGTRLTERPEQVKEEIRALRDLLKVHWGREVA